MTLRWLEGFEGMRHETIAARLYDAVTGTMLTTPGPRGSNAAFSTNMVMRTPELVNPDENSWVLGFNFRIHAGQLNTSPSARPYVAFRSAAGEQLRLEAVDAPDTSKPGGIYYKWRVMRGATELARTEDRFEAVTATGKWNYFEWKVTINTSTNGSFELKYHRPKISNIMATWDAATTGINTANQGAAGADRIEIAWTTGDAGDSVAYDNIYLVDSDGVKNNDYLGEVYIEGLDPQGNGNSLQWDLEGSAASIEDAWNEAADAQNITEDDKRVTSDTPGNVELATMTNLVDITNTPVVGVQLRVYGKMETTGASTVATVFRKTTGTPAQTQGGLVTFTTTAFDGFADTREDDPNTGTDWVPADINGIELGVEHDS